MPLQEVVQDRLELADQRPCAHEPADLVDSPVLRVGGARWRPHDGAMNDTRRAAVELARHCGSCSDQFLEAAGHLPAEQDQLALPRIHLLGLALEYRLKAYLCAVRGGVPYTPDLGRLAALARHCGLVLTPGQLEWISALERERLAAVTEADLPAPASIRDLCEAISAQTFGEP
jgi:hypothetical protein